MPRYPVRETDRKSDRVLPDLVMETMAFCSWREIVLYHIPFSCYSLFSFEFLLSVCPSPPPFVHLSLLLYPSICLRVLASVRQSVISSVRLSLCPSVRLSVCSSVCMSLPPCLSLLPSFPGDEGWWTGALLPPAMGRSCSATSPMSNLAKDERTRENSLRGGQLSRLQFDAANGKW